MGSLSPVHLLLLILVVVLLFGSRKLPDAARAVGRSLRILKAETASLREDDDRREQEAARRDARSYREERPRDAYPEDRYPAYRDDRDRDYRDRQYRDQQYRDQQYRDQDNRDRHRDGVDRRAVVDDRVPLEHPMETRAVEGPQINPNGGGTRADSRTPDIQPH